MKKVLYSAIALTLFPMLAQTAAFTPNNLLLLRVGDGNGTLINTGNAAFIDEYSISPNGTATLVQSIALPTQASATSPVQRQCVLSGAAASEGQLARSSDGASVTTSCYGSNIPSTNGALNGTTGTVVPRVIAQIKADGSVDTTTALSDYASGNNPRSVVSDGVGFWAVGGTGGVRYATLGASTSTDVSTAITNIRYIDISGGNLFVSHGSAVAASRIAQIGSGLPTTSGQLAVDLTGFPTVAGASPYQFFFVDLDPAVAGDDTVYVADDGAAEAIQKWCKVNGTWTLVGSINTFADAVPRVNPRSVTGRFLPGQGVAMASVFDGNTLAIAIDNTGFNNAPAGVVLLPVVRAPANIAYRGLSATPVAPAGRDFKDGFEDVVPASQGARILW
jgi:hypothetical protein